MKKIILLIGVIIMLIAAHVAFGQDQEGVITYEISINVHRTLPADRQDMKAMVPSSGHSNSSFSLLQRSRYTSR